MSSKSRFRPNSRRYELVWPEEHELAGLEVTMRAMRLGEMESLGRTHDKYQEAEDVSAQMALLADLIERVGKVLVAWNRIDEDTIVEGDDESGEVLPTTAEGLRALEDWEFMEILRAYMDTAVGVSAPLADGSTNGSASPVELPMTVEQ